MLSSPPRRQVVISSAESRSRRSISRRVLASSDSGIPNMRSVKPSKGSARSSTAATGSGSRAPRGHIAWSSRGGPGRTITVGPLGRARPGPGAVPAGSIAVAPSGTIACFRLASRRASASKCIRRAKLGEDRARSSPPSPRRGPARGRRSWPTTSAVRSSAVGPSPPLVTIRSTPCARARNRSAASRSSGRSPTQRMWVTSTPSSPSRSEIQGPLRSVTRPVRTSVPVTRIPARTLTGSPALAHGQSGPLKLVA